MTAFGTLLKELHADYETARGAVLSHDAIARMVIARVRRGYPNGPSLSFAGSTLWRWEEGLVGSPDPLALRELAAIYGSDFHQLLAVLVENRLRPDLSTKDARRMMQEGNVRGPASAAASARVQQLEQLLEERNRFIAQLQDAAIKMFRLFQPAAEDRAAGETEPGRRRIGGKARG